MSLWLVRAGRHGEQESGALQSGVAVIGWNELPDLSKIKTRDDLRKLYEQAYPSAKSKTVSNEVGQIWTFIHRIKQGDLVALPSKFTSTIAIGEVTGIYQFRTDLDDNLHHTIDVKWLNKEIPRNSFDQDVLFSLGAFMTVCQIQRNDAEKRVRAMLTGKKSIPAVDDDVLEDQELLDVELAAQDQIIRYISEKYKGHELTHLVEAVLQAEGYVTSVSRPGPDGGIDILAGTGPMGFGSPRVGVQVKSSQSPVDVTVLRNLQGVLKNFGAEQGLLVSWGGFNRAVLEEARRNFFTVRLWDSTILIQEIFKHYDKLPDTLQAELPLKRIWALIPEEEE